MKTLKIIILLLCLFVIIGCLYLAAALPNLDFIKVSFLGFISIICFVISFIIVENFNHGL
jgi:hypothetical protein